MCTVGENPDTCLMSCHMVPGERDEDQAETGAAVEQRLWETGEMAGQKQVCLAR